MKTTNTGLKNWLLTHRPVVTNTTALVKTMAMPTTNDRFVAITGGRLDLGPWEAIFYGEFDGRRNKRVLVKIIGD
jgi:thiamine phosphate synthase YjbQ (UPF0047 family)